MSPARLLLLPGLLLAASCGISDTEDATAPAIAITAPTGSTVSHVEDFTASVEDDTGVDTVEFWVGEERIFEDKTKPYGTTWNTANGPDGPVILKVVAWDLAGNRSSLSKEVTVNNAPN